MCLRLFQSQTKKRYVTFDSGQDMRISVYLFIKKLIILISMSTSSTDLVKLQGETILLFLPFRLGFSLTDLRGVLLAGESCL